MCVLRLEIVHHFMYALFIFYHKLTSPLVSVVLLCPGRYFTGIGQHFKKKMFMLAIRVDKLLCAPFLTFQSGFQLF